MEYYILDQNNKQAGPYSTDQLKAMNISRSTLAWCQGMAQWARADSIQELQTLFIGVPPDPPHQPQASSFHFSSPLTFKPIYDNFFDISSLSQEELNDHKKHDFYDYFSTGAGIALHIFTLGIFTFIACGLKFSKLPMIHRDDFRSGKAIGYMFIPIFNIYWQFIYWRSLAKRINYQFKLRNKPAPISVDLATTSCILTLIPYLGGIVNFLILIPILYSQIQNACNELAQEKMENRRRI